jgi:hypothetical protein
MNAKTELLVYIGPSEVVSLCTARGDVQDEYTWCKDGTCPGQIRGRCVFRCTGECNFPKEFAVVNK